MHHETPGFHLDVCAAITEPNPRVLINMPPYHSKSTLVTVWHTVYDVCRDPNLRTLIVSKSLPFARTFMHSISEMLQNHELYGDGPNPIVDWGPFKADGQSKWSSEQIYVSGRTTAEKDPTVAALGVGQQIYGRRADVIKFDDVATLDNQRNPDRVAQMLHAWGRGAQASAQSLNVAHAGHPYAMPHMLADHIFRSARCGGPHKLVYGMTCSEVSDCVRWGAKLVDHMLRSLR